MERAVRRMRKLLPFLIGLVAVAAIACGEGSSPEAASLGAPASATGSEALEVPTPSWEGLASASAPAVAPAPSEVVAAADKPEVSPGS